MSAAYECTAHATHEYPRWWQGRRFEQPIAMWAAGDTRETTRDIVQLELFGTREELRGGTPSGNGDIYTECLLRTATTDGLIIATFTPLRGLTPFVDHYLETAEMVDAEETS